MTHGHLRRGFTLIELLVVIAIIGLLSTLAVVSLSSARAKARDAQRVAAVTQLKTALELYRSDNLKGADGYPNPNPGAVAAVTLGDTNHACLDASTAGFVAKGSCGASGAAIHMQQVQADPLSGQAYHFYGFKSDGSTACDANALCQSYLMTFQLEGAASGNFGKGWNCVSDKLPGGTKTADANGVSTEVTTAADCKL